MNSAHPSSLGRITWPRKLIGVAALLLLFSFCLAPRAGAAMYYVAPTGSDSAAGTQAAPWRSIQRAVNAAQAGDVISIQAGVYREQVRLSGRNGTPTNWITVRPFEGDDVIIDPSTPVSGWVRLAGNLYISGPIGFGSSGVRTLWNGPTALIRVDRLSELTADGTFWVDSANDRVRIFSSTDPSVATYTASRGDERALSIVSASYIRVDGLIVQHGASGVVIGTTDQADVPDTTQIELRNLTVQSNAEYGIVPSGSPQNPTTSIRIDGAVVRDTRSSRSGTSLSGDGIRLLSRTTTSHSRDVTIEACRISRSARHNVNLADGWSDITVRHSVIADGGLGGAPSAGIRIAGSGVQCEGNEISGAAQDGIDVASPAANVVLVRNLIHENHLGVTVHSPSSAGAILIANVIRDNRSSGIRVDRGQHLAIVNNTLVQNGDDAVVLVGSGHVVKNNLIASGGQRALVLDPGSTTDHNLLFQSHPGQEPLIQSGGIGMTLVGYWSATGQELHGVEADPVLVSGPTGAFQPTVASPAIDRGEDLGVQTAAAIDYRLRQRPIGSAWDIGAYEYDPRDPPVPSAVPRIIISMSRYPETAQHTRDAQAAGKPRILTLDRPGAAARRMESLRGYPKVPGKDLDEYPPAMFKEGGRGADVRAVTSADNRGAGSSMSHQARPFADGQQVELVVE